MGCVEHPIFRAILRADSIPKPPDLTISKAASQMISFVIVVGFDIFK